MEFSLYYIDVDGNNGIASLSLTFSSLFKKVALHGVAGFNTSTCEAEPGGSRSFGGQHVYIVSSRPISAA